MTAVFPQQNHAEELRQLLRGDYKQFSLIPVNVNAVGTDANTNRGLIEVEGNGLVVVPRILDKDLVERISSVAARVYIRFNHEDNPWLPFSLITSSLDFSSITATIGKFWVRVSVNDAGKFIYLAVTKGATMGGSGTTGGVTGGGYMTPAGG